MYCMAQAIESSQQPKRFLTSPSARIFQETENLTRHDAVQSITASSQQPGPSSPKRARLAQPTPQPQPEDLAKLGIKVRDFAYESKLPPIPPFRRKPLQQGLLKSPKRLRRFGQEDVDDEDVFSVDKRPRLQRVDTEPVIEEPVSQRIAAYSDITRLPPLLLPPSRASVNDSQESEPYIDTPLVTPNGSLNWRVKDTSSIPASQLDTVSQATVPDLISMTQLGLAHLTDSQPDDMEIEPVAVTVPDSPTPTFATAPRLVSPFPSKASSPPIPSSPPATPPVNVPSSSTQASPRYSLRKRPSSHSEPSRTRPRLSSRSTTHSRTSDHKSGSPTTPRPTRKSGRSASRSKRDTHS
ncbi:uncharacterized protein BT62DRAFT_686448 [Guyanagaster necrorhizus]|uniref:Uncharacterized protein n=1 Tax=Guyanagaster necrorhizus TaxID=856835 RepID=A0A9P8AVM4_9AGAR|nr:uncharacterized protein BT62DRAFT_686448 [Guyanagaster necrorhizus MCA 3950]KAG7449480.1 hypothetical protein BT62DRAFT_686448 [Guyanagaster necrorhizus MCA 3950]